MRRGGPLRALTAPLQACQEAEVARVVEDLVGPDALQLFQQRQHQFLTGVARLYSDTLRVGGHDHARGVLLSKLETLGRRLGIDLPTAGAGEEVEAGLRVGPEFYSAELHFGRSTSQLKGHSRCLQTDGAGWSV